MEGYRDCTLRNKRAWKDYIVSCILVFRRMIWAYFKALSSFHDSMSHEAVATENHVSHRVSSFLA
jgi:hypothetical protein